MVTNTRIGMPIAVFMAQFDGQPFELINGEKKLKMASPYLHSLIMRALFRLLDAFALQHPGIEAFFETTFILPDAYDSGWVSGSRIPDLMVYTNHRVAAWQQVTPEYAAQPLAVVPDLVIEIISENDKYSEVEEKVDEYLADGVRLVVLVDPQRKRAVVRMAETPPNLLDEQDILRFADILPGFEVHLAALFATSA